MIEDMKQQFLELLVSIGFVDYSLYVAEKKRVQNGNFTTCPVVPAYNVHSSSLPIINSILTAGLYPNLLLLTSQISSSVSFPVPVLINPSTKSVVSIHPASINFKEELRAQWFVYHTMVMSNKIYVWDSNAVSSFPVFLFGGDVVVEHGNKLVTIDKYIKLKCYAKTAVIFKRLRAELNAVLKMRINEPGLHEKNASQQHAQITSIIVKLLESEYDKEKRILMPVIK